MKKLLPLVAIPVLIIAGLASCGPLIHHNPAYDPDPVSTPAQVTPKSSTPSPPKVEIPDVDVPDVKLPTSIPTALPTSIPTLSPENKERLKKGTATLKELAEKAKAEADKLKAEHDAQTSQ